MKGTPIDMVELNCDKVRQLLFDFINDELDNEIKETVTAHLEDCADCRRELEYCRKTLALLSESRKAPERSLSGAVLASVRKPRRRRMWYRYGTAVAAMITLVAVVGVGAGILQNLNSTDAASAPLKNGFKEGEPTAENYGNYYSQNDSVDSEVYALSNPAVSPDASSAPGDESVVSDKSAAAGCSSEITAAATRAATTTAPPRTDPATTTVQNTVAGVPATYSSVKGQTDSGAAVTATKTDGLTGTNDISEEILMYSGVSNVAALYIAETSPAGEWVSSEAEKTVITDSYDIYVYPESNADAVQRLEKLSDTANEKSGERVALKYLYDAAGDKRYYLLAVLKK